MEFQTQSIPLEVLQVLTGYSLKMTKPLIVLVMACLGDCHFFQEHVVQQMPYCNILVPVLAKPGFPFWLINTLCIHVNKWILLWVEFLHQSVCLLRGFSFKFCPIRSDKKRLGSNFCREFLIYCSSRIKQKLLAGPILISDL